MSHFLASLPSLQTSSLLFSPYHFGYVLLFASLPTFTSSLHVLDHVECPWIRLAFMCWIMLNVLGYA